MNSEYKILFTSSSKTNTTKPWNHVLPRDTYIDGKTEEKLCNDFHKI